MRRRALFPILAALTLLAGLAAADVVVLKDGRTLQTVGPPVLKGRTALLKTPDGKLFSIPMSEIDQAKTEAARAVPTPAPTPTPTPLRPARPGEIAGKKSERRATVVLTDEQVASGALDLEGEKKDESGEERIEVTNVVSNRTPDGYSLSGSVLNSGKVEVGGIGVTIEAVGAEGKTIASAFGQIAKDRLAPGEKSTFVAEMKGLNGTQTFRYRSSWQTKVAVKGAAAQGAAEEPGAFPTPPKPPEEGESPGAKGEGGERTAGAPAPTPTPTLIRISQPDVAPRVPNAPIGAPEKPGGTFIPKPTGDQPKTPGGN